MWAAAFEFGSYYCTPCEQRMGVASLDCLQTLHYYVKWFIVVTRAAC